MNRRAHRAIENQPFDLSQTGVDPERFKVSVQRVNRRLGTSWKSPDGESPVQFTSFEGMARFSGIAGYISLADNEFVISPKYSSRPEAADELIDLLPIAVAFEPSCLRIDPRGVRAQRFSRRMRDLVGAYFAVKLSSALQSQPLRVYLRVQKRQSLLRGRLLIEKHLRTLPHKRHQLPCEFSEFTQYNPIVGLLRWCASELRRTSRLRSVRRRLAAVESAMPPVNFDVSGPLPMFESIPAAASEYREPVRLAIEVARERRGAAPGAPTPRMPRSQTASVLVLTHKAFQGIVSAVLTEAAKPLGLSERRQQSRRYAWRMTNHAERRLTPDEVLVDREREPILVGDAKYVGRSGGRNGVGSEHFYQVSAAARVFGVGSALIVAPRIERMGDEFEEWELVSSRGERAVVVGVYRLDLERLAAEPSGVIRSVTDALHRIIGS